MAENKNMTEELNEALKGMWESLSDEQKEKAKKCRTMDELMQLAGRYGIELPDEALDAVAGGITWPHDATGTWENHTCPYCKKTKNIHVLAKEGGYVGNDLVRKCTCPSCNRVYYQTSDGVTYDLNHQYLGTFKIGC